MDFFREVLPENTQLPILDPLTRGKNLIMEQLHSKLITLSYQIVYEALEKLPSS
jgi:hypothetical protein